LLRLRIFITSRLVSCDAAALRYAILRTRLAEIISRVIKLPYEKRIKEYRFLGESSSLATRRDDFFGKLAPPSIARKMSLHPYHSLEGGCHSDVDASPMCTYTRTRTYSCARGLARKARGIPRGALIDVTITAIYPEAVSLRYENDAADPPRERGGQEGARKKDETTEGLLDVSCRRRQRGATMAKYKSKSRPPSFLTSPLPPQICTPLSSSFVHPAPPTRAAPVPAVALYPRFREFLSYSIHSAGLARFARFLIRISLCRSRPRPLSSALIHPRTPPREFLPYPRGHFGFHPRTSRPSDEIMDDKLNRK